MISSHHAVTQIKNGRVVAYPTESFYALGADATNPKAIRNLFRLKKRNAKKPIALIAADIAQVQKFFYLGKEEVQMAKKYWPGPVTILLQPKVPVANPVVEDDKRYIATRALGIEQKRKPASDRGVIGGLVDALSSGTLPQPAMVGVRIPGHARARRLAKLAGVPLTATSANISGRRPTKNEKTIKKTWPELPILFGLCGKQNLPSTVVSIEGSHIRVIRSGSIRI